VSVSESATISPAAHNADVEVEIVPARRDFETSFTPGEPVPILLGARNGSTAVGNQDLTIRIEQPDGTVETFNRTTNTNGTVRLDYTPPADVEGEFEIQAGPDSNTYVGFWDFIVGPQVQSINPGIADTVPTGSEVTTSVLVTEAAEPIANSERTVTIQAPDGSTTTRTVVTDTDGYATFNWTPQQTGRYFISPDLPGDGSSFEVGEYAAVTRVNGDDFSTEADPGDQIAVAGNILSGSGPGTNTEIEIGLVNTTSFQNEEVVKTVSTTTDDTGTFYTDIELPSDPDATEYEFQLQTAAGESIATGFLQVELGDDTSGPDERDELEVSVSGNTSYALPGDTVELTVEAEEIATDGTTSPYANGELTLRPQIAFDQPIGAFTMATDADGTATVEYTVPSNLPDGVQLDFGATAPYNGTVNEPFFEINVQEYRLEDEREDPVPGEETQYQITATDVATGEPVSDLPIMLSAERGNRRASVYATESARTNSSGVATVPIQTPADVNGEVYYGTFARYESANTYPTFFVSAYEATLTGLDSFEYQAGETLSVTYDGPIGSTAVVTVRSFDDNVPSPLITEQVSAGDQLTFTIPSDVPDDTTYSVEALTANQQGQVAQPREFFRVTANSQNTPPTAAFTASPEVPSPGDTVTLDASGSSDSDGSIVSYNWDLNDDGEFEETGETTEVTFDAAGSYDVTLQVTDDAGTTDVTTETIEVESTTTTNGTVSLVPDSVRVTPNGSATADIVINGTGDIAAYSFAASIDSAATSITDVTLAGSPGISDVSISADGSQAEASAAAAEVDATQGATIATIELAGAPANNTTLTVSVGDVSDANGTAYPLSQPNATATVSAQDQIPDISGNGNPPTDEDGDGLYEDVNGDGDATIADVQAFFTSYNSDTVANNSAAFDFNGDGSVTISDVQALFDESV
jgi:PKD repeat protein